jgi:predicted RNase H-like nuclease (RuvC/YqgF family)
MQELSALEVSFQDLSTSGLEKFKSLVEIAKVLELNPFGTSLELALIEKIIKFEEKKLELANEITHLDLVQEVCKESLVLLCEIEQITPASEFSQNIQNSKSLEQEVEELKEKVQMFQNKPEDQSIQHQQLVKISVEIEELIHEVDKLQKKYEIYQDFPVVSCI